jgi:hypothetical protein
MSILDNLAGNAENQWLSEKLEDNPEEDQALQTTARVMTAHIWPFLAAAISDEDYQARRGVKTDEVRFVCATVAPHMASALADYVLDGFDADYDLLRKTAQEEGLLADELLPALLGSAEDKGGDDDGDEGPFSNPKVEHLVREAPGGGVHGPYYIREVGGGYDVVNAQGESKGHHDTKAQAREQQKALYVHIPEAREQAESREGKAPPKAVQEVGEPGSEEQREHEGSLRVAAAFSTPEELAAAMARHMRDHHDYGVSSDPADMDWVNELHSDDHQHNADLMDHTHRSKTSARRRVAQGDPYSTTTLLPKAKDDDDNDSGDNEAPEPIRRQVEHHTPGFFSNPKADQELEDPGTYYGLWGAGGQSSRAAAMITIDRYGHISLGVSRLPEYGPQGGYDRSRDPQQDEGPDPFEEYWEGEESRSPERDVHFHHDEPHYEADWERPSEEGWEGHYRGGVRERRPHTSAEKEKGTVPCPICHKKFEPGELAEHMKTVHHVSEGEEEGKERGKKAPGSARAGQSKAKPSAGRQTHRPTRGRPKGPAKQGQLVRSSQRPPGASRSPAPVEGGYDPSEAFPGYYGAPEPPRRPRTAQAPLTGQSDVPQDPESTTGASGMYDPSSALNVASPGGVVDTDFNQQDEPQDIQAQLGQMPALGHKIGAKLAEMAAEVLTYNPGLSAVAAMEVALKAVRLYPKVAAGGADYLAEPGTEGVPTEVLTDCPQCQRRAYNAEINRCHFCGFYDAGLEPSIEVT